MEALRSTWIVFAAHQRQIFFSKRALVCVLFCLGPVAAAVLALLFSEQKGAMPAFEIGWMLMVQGTVPLISLIIGSAVVAEEIEDRTITYLFSRPIPRLSVLLGRWVASLLLIELLLGASAVVTFGVLEVAAGADAEMALPQGMAASMRNTCLIGGAVYSALFAAISALVKHPMIVGIGYAFVVEFFVANFPGQNQNFTVQFHLKSYLAGSGEEVLARMRNLTQDQILVPADESFRTLLVVLVAALAIGCWTVSRKQYVLTS